MSTQKLNHLSDSHGSDLDYEEILEDDVYETGDLIDQNDFNDLEEAVMALDEEIAERDEHVEESDSEWYLIPGNHDLTGNHDQAPSYEEIREQVDEELSVYSAITGKEGDDPENAESIYDVVISQYDNIVDARDTVVEKEDHVVYFGDSHLEPEIPDPDARDKGFGYDFEEISDEIEEEDPTKDFGLFDYLNPLNWGTILESFDKDYEVEPDELDISDVPEELMTEGHQAYKEEKEHIMNQIEGYDKPVVLADHAVTRDEQWNKSSDINRELAEEGYIDMVLGGHDHSNGMKEIGEATVINSANGYSEIELEDGTYHDHSYTALEQPNPPQERQGTQTPIDQESVEQMAQNIPDGRVDDQALEIVKEREGLEGEEAVQKAKEIMAAEAIRQQSQETQQPQQPRTPGNSGESETQGQAGA